MNNPEIVNIYIERLINEVQEGVKNRILLETQLKYSESINNSLAIKVEELEKQIDKQTKKLNKKEVDTSDTF